MRYGKQKKLTNRWKRTQRQGKLRGKADKSLNPGFMASQSDLKTK